MDPFTAKTIGVAVVLSIGSSSLIETFEKRDWIRALRVVMVVGALASVFCVLAGLDMLQTGWADPLAGADSQAIARGSVQARGKGGIFLLLIRFWPYVLVGLFGLALVNQARSAFNAHRYLQEQRQAASFHTTGAHRSRG